MNNIVNALLLLILLCVGSIAYGQESTTTGLTTPVQDGPIQDGPYTKYYQDGKVESKVVYKGGKRNGVEQNYNDDGVLREEITYVDDIKEGEEKQYDQNGKLEAQWTNHNGKRDGLYRGYFSDGTLAEECSFKAGVFVDPEGKPYNGIYQVNYPDGKPYKKFSYKDGLSDGVFQLYASTGRLEEEYVLVNGELHGMASNYDSQTGDLLAKVPYQHNKVNGLVQEFENGKVVSEYFAVDNNKHGPFKKYEEDGGHWEGGAVNGVIQGEIKFYDAKNRLRTCQMMQNNEPVGEAIVYDEKGKVFPKPVVLDAEKERGLFFGLWFIVFIVSLTVHEAAHAWAALKLGDETAYNGGQVSINPLPHIRREPVGMLVLPMISYWTQGWMIGWASAPYNPQWALAHPRRAALMSLAGPLSNLIMVGIAACALRLGLWAGLFTYTDNLSATALFGGVSPGLSAILVSFLSILFFLNIILFAFNLMPLPPLDGSGAVPLILPQELAVRYMAFVNHPTVMIMGLIFAWKLFDWISPPIIGLFTEILYFGL